MARVFGRSMRRSASMPTVSLLLEVDSNFLFVYNHRKKWLAASLAAALATIVKLLLYQSFTGHTYHYVD